MVKFLLKQNWSEQFVYDDNSGELFFVGRDQEKRNLGSIILNNKSSTILISSVRGFGKTSFVHKTLDELHKKEKKISPIFVNVGHSIDKNNFCKRQLLISLIRASADALPDQIINDLYRKTYSKYKLEIINKKEEGAEIEYSFKKQFSLNKEQIMACTGIIISSFGLSIDILRLKIVLFSLGILFSGIIIKFRLRKKEINNNEEIYTIDDSIEHLEIEFEKRLKSINKKGDHKLIFVIDELDKIKEEESFVLIKEYKNLFSRSFAHFIFITGPESYKLTTPDKRLDENNGIFPTLFTHIFYLQLPSPIELQGYLNQVFDNNFEQSEEFENLKKYLLFRSGNDFFSLKRLLSDLVLFNEETAFLDIDNIKNHERSFNDICKIYDYVTLYYKKYSRLEKKYWQKNAELQKNIFGFLNKNLGIVIDKSNIQGEFPLLLEYGFFDYLSKRTGILLDNIVQYVRAYNYKKLSDVEALFPTEDDFLKDFNSLIDIANKISFLGDFVNGIGSEHYNGEYLNIVCENKDGNQFTGINLFNTYQRYISLKNIIEISEDRMSISADESYSASKEITQQLSFIKDDFYNICYRLHNRILINNNIETNTLQSYQNQFDFNSYPNIYSILQETPHQYIVKLDNTKKLIIIDNFVKIKDIETDLKTFANDKNFLILNVIKDENIDINPKILLAKKGKKKNIIVSNFINYKFDINNITDTLNIIKVIFNHLKD